MNSADHSTRAGSATRRAWALPLIFLTVAGFATWDLIEDMEEGESAGHVALEGVLVACGLVGLAWEGRRFTEVVRRSHRLAGESRVLAQRLDDTERDAARWREQARDLLEGLSGAIDDQLERWALSPAEKETALLLLKGLSHRDVAEVRGVSEATARQQARALYKKAGLDGRHDLAAFFLEDLLSGVGDARRPREA